MVAAVLTKEQHDAVIKTLNFYANPDNYGRFEVIELDRGERAGIALEILTGENLHEPN